MKRAPSAAPLLLFLALPASPQQQGARHHRHRAEDPRSPSSETPAPRAIPESNAFLSLMNSGASSPPARSAQGAPPLDAPTFLTLSPSTLGDGYYGYDDSYDPVPDVVEEDDPTEPPWPDEDLDEDDEPAPEPPKLSGGAAMDVGDVETACEDESARLGCSGRQGQALVSCLLAHPAALSLDCASSIRRLPALKAASSVGNRQP